MDIMGGKLRKWLNKPGNEKWNSVLRLISRYWNILFYAHFGNRSMIKKPIIINGKKNISIGDHVTIREGARIECLSRWNDDVLEYKPHLTINDRVSIEQRVHIACAQSINIGNDVTISLNVTILDCSHDILPVENNVLENKLITAPVEIGSYSFIGAGAVIMKGVKIGKNVVIGANAVVNKSIPDFCIAAGVPAKVIKRYNQESNVWEEIR